jgi:predicted nuclease of predicted toxin-antitoxin system
VSAVKYLFDEDFNRRIVRGVRRQGPSLNTLTVQEAGLREATDPAVLERAAAEGRMVVSHDHKTMRAYAEERLLAGLPMAGLILVRQDYPVGQAIDDLLLIGETTTEEEWQGKIIFLPL